MEQKQHKSTKGQEKSLLKIEASVNKNLFIGTLIATLIAITPFLFTLYESVPTTQVWDTFLFKYDSKIYEEARYAMWVFTGKAVPLLLLFVWFFTCRHWWFHVLLVPIAMYIFQILKVFSEDNRMDEFQLIYMLPVMAIVIPTIYLIRARIFNKINTANKSMQELEDEFKMSPKNFWEKVKEYF